MRRFCLSHFPRQNHNQCIHHSITASHTCDVVVYRHSGGVWCMVRAWFPNQRHNLDGINHNAIIPNKPPETHNKCFGGAHSGIFSPHSAKGKATATTTTTAPCQWLCLCLCMHHIVRSSFEISSFSCKHEQHIWKLFVLSFTSEISFAHSVLKPCRLFALRQYLLIISKNSVYVKSFSCASPFHNSLASLSHIHRIVYSDCDSRSTAYTYINFIFHATFDC